MPTFVGEFTVLELVLWNLAGFGGAFIINSFIEWAAHKYILHSDRFLEFAYELHDQNHHILFGDDESYVATTDSEEDKQRREHITFVPRDYILFLLVTTPLWIGAEFLIGLPLFIGGVVATFTGLQMFNSFHWRYHVPSDTWFQRTRFFKFLANHHRIHHGEPWYNLNVSFLPIADFVLGTLKRK